jgi:hypothetical protein
MLVSRHVEFTEFTRMLYCPSSRARHVISPVTACFDAAYDDMFSAPLSASVDPMKTTEPPSPCEIRVGTAALTACHAPVRLMSTVCRQASVLISHVLPPAQMPAFGMTISTRPSSFKPRWKAASTWS